MSLENDLRVFINADATVNALLGGRLYRIVLRQRPTFPAATFQVISTQRGHTMTGPDWLGAVRFQIDCYSPVIANAWSLDTAIRQRIDGFKGAMGDSEVQGVFFETSREMFEEDKGVKLYRVSADYEIWSR